MGGYPPVPEGRLEELPAERLAILIVIPLLPLLVTVIDSGKPFPPVHQHRAENPPCAYLLSLNENRLIEYLEGVTLAYLRGKVYIPGEDIGEFNNKVCANSRIDGGFVEGLVYRPRCEGRNNRMRYINR